jgi:hypothetical protein
LCVFDFAVIRISSIELILVKNELNVFDLDPNLTQI